MQTKASLIIGQQLALLQDEPHKVPTDNTLQILHTGGTTGLVLQPSEL